MTTLSAPVLDAFRETALMSSPWPTSATKATTGHLYLSLIHLRRTEVSSPPEYARTIFLVMPNSSWDDFRSRILLASLRAGTPSRDDDEQRVVARDGADDLGPAHPVEGQPDGAGLAGVAS